MDVETLFAQTLAALGVVVCQPPVDAAMIGDAQTWCVFREVPGTFDEYASNDPTRFRHLVQLHVFSRREDGEHKRVWFKALRLLHARGVRCGGFEMDDYEEDTGIHHIAGTCEWVGRVDPDKW